MTSIGSYRVSLWRTRNAAPSSGGGGGIRKLRYALAGGGKSGGIRVIYYWVTRQDQIYLLIVYPKSKKDNLTARETAVLRTYVKELSHGQDPL